MPIEPQYIVPVLIPQPTWGGQYIAEYKHISDTHILEQNIGQSYELSGSSVVHSDHQSAGLYGVASADHPKEIVFSHSCPTRKLSEVIAESPEEALGSTVTEKYGPSCPILIKFTQAQENSYQLHVKPGKEFGDWKAKPESWYYLENGVASLGLQNPSSVTEYQHRCQAIYAFATETAQKIERGEWNLDQGRAELQNFIDQDHPRRFVNTVTVRKNQIVELGQGGVHHSWESSPEYPLGNIVYEVQLDVLDNESTLRSFDQGKIKDDGSIRPLQIDDYFSAIDTSEDLNQPENLMQTHPEQFDASGVITKLFDNQYYTMSRVQFSQEYSGPSTTTSGSFHHVFALKETIYIGWQGKKWTLQPGYSLFIPASVGKYTVLALDRGEVLITQVK